MTATRYDRLADRFGEGTAQRLIKEEDRRCWALYRTLDLTQSEVQDTVRSYADTSQATVSRATREGDDRVLTEDDYVDLGGGFDIESVRDEYHPEAWFEAYRDVLATAVTDSAALEIIATDERLTPEWAARRFYRAKKNQILPCMVGGGAADRLLPAGRRRVCVHTNALTELGRLH